MHYSNNSINSNCNNSSNNNNSNDNNNSSNSNHSNDSGAPVCARLSARAQIIPNMHILAIFYPSSQFCKINISLPSLQNQPKTAPNLFQRGVE